MTILTNWFACISACLHRFKLATSETFLALGKVVIVSLLATARTCGPTCLTINVNYLEFFTNTAKSLHVTPPSVVS